MAGIFISYRRADSDGWAGRLRDALRARFGDLVFQDVDNIGDGEIFSEVIDRALQACNVALVVIGPNWATARDEHGRRLDHEEDWVRTETAMVLNRKIRVIPVLVGGASLPRAEELPPDLRSLTKRQARQIRSATWDADVGLLASQLEQIVGPRRRPLWLYALAPLVVLAGIAVYAGSRFFADSVPPPAPVDRTASSPPAAPVQRQEPIRAPPDAAPPAPGTAADAPKPAEPAAAIPAQTVPVPAPREDVAAPAPAPVAPPTRPQPKPSVRPSATPTDQPKIAKAAPGIESPPSRREGAAPAPRPRPPGVAQQADGTPPPRTPEPGRAAPKPDVETAAAAGAVTLPNRPASSRALMIGDKWTYRLREIRFNRLLATVTHEITGDDPNAIRESVSGGRAGRGAERRLAFAPRIYEHPVAGGASLFEFAPYLQAFTELRPGVTWRDIAGAASSDSINAWRINGKVTGRERITVPAGTFVAIRVELEGELNLSSPSTFNVAQETTPGYQTCTIWFVPDVGRAVKYERRTYNRARLLLDHEQYELVSYELK